MSEVVEHRQENISSDYPDTIQSISTLLEWQEKISRRVRIENSSAVLGFPTAKIDFLPDRDKVPAPFG